MTRKPTHIEMLAAMPYEQHSDIDAMCDDAMYGIWYLINAITDYLGVPLGESKAKIIACINTNKYYELRQWIQDKL